jgi:hypothetical protein
MSSNAKKVLDEDNPFYILVDLVKGKRKAAKYTQSEVAKLVPCLEKLRDRLEQLRQAGDQYKYYKHL